MNVVFLTLFNITDIENHDIYSDLMRTIADKGHNVYIVSPVERRFKQKTHFIETDKTGAHKNVRILKVKTGNVQKTNIIEKGISTVLLEGQIKRAVRKYLKGVKVDLVLYSTPPITLYKPIKYLKKNGARTYLMLKDIFPQNAVDLGMLKTGGLKGVIYKYFRKKEKRLYAVSDKIGCMSPANVEYLLKNNTEISSDKVEVFPNCLEIKDFSIDGKQIKEMREKYGLPLDKKIFVYGGNLGKPQDIPFIIECLKNQRGNNKAVFLIIGNGTEFIKLKKYKEQSGQENFLLFDNMDRNEYDRLVCSCDVGLIFLDHRFTIPNFPSRVLSYMQAKLPVLACTDENTDIGKVIVDGGFGWACYSNDVTGFSKCVESAVNCDIAETGSKGYKYLADNYNVKTVVEKIGL